MDENLMAMHYIETLIFKGEGEDTSFLKINVCYAGHGSDGTSAREDGGVDVYGCDVPGRQELGETDGDGAGAGADVEEGGEGVGGFEGVEFGEEVGGAVFSGADFVEGCLGGGMGGFGAWGRGLGHCWGWWMGLERN